MTMSRFRVAPREGHVQCFHWIFGYLRRFPDAAIRFRTGYPDIDNQFQFTESKWDYSVYDGCKEDIPNTVPPALGLPVRMTTFVDANLMHCKVTGKSATGILHFVNQTPIEWFSKRQNTVETATYGSEFVAARQAVEQVIDLRLTLRYMGVPIEDCSYILGDNQSVITTAESPVTGFNKRHNALSVHRVRSSIAAGFIKFGFIPGAQNPADILTKFLPYASFWPLIQPILFWKGNTDA